MFFDLYSLLLSNRFMEAFEKYYDENILVVDLRYGMVKGKEANLANRNELFKSIIEIKDLDVRSAAFDDGVSIVEWDISAEMVNRGLVSFNFVVVHNWRSGKIIKEKYFSAPTSV